MHWRAGVPTEACGRNTLRNKQTNKKKPITTNNIIQIRKKKRRKLNLTYTYTIKIAKGKTSIQEAKGPWTGNTERERPGNVDWKRAREITMQLTNIQGQQQQQNDKLKATIPSLFRIA